MSELAICTVVEAPAVQVPRRSTASRASHGIETASRSSAGGDGAPARAAQAPALAARGTRVEGSSGVLGSLRETLLEFMVRQAGPGVPVRKPELTPSRS
jgi:hypothetical protein